MGRGACVARFTLCPVSSIWAGTLVSAQISVLMALRLKSDVQPLQMYKFGGFDKCFSSK